MAKEFYSNGKLLITGEYAVLDGALALAVPTGFGQSLSFIKIDSHKLLWKSRDENEKVWFETEFDLRSFPLQAVPSEHDPLTKTLWEILCEAQKLNPDFLRDDTGYQVDTQLTFPRDWGLGSSSTLINNIAQWAEVDAYGLLRNTFSGSGYDIACAQHRRPILYRLHNEMQVNERRAPPSPGREVSEIDFNPSFQDKLYFVHLNKKQNSRDGIATYRKMDFDKPHLVQVISEITQKVISCEMLSEFESLITEHESLLSRILQIPTVKESLFPDFKGAIKSLGAWGGDFVLATGDGETPSYFEKLGYRTVVPYEEMVLGDWG